MADKPLGNNRIDNAVRASGDVNVHHFDATKTQLLGHRIGCAARRGGVCDCKSKIVNSVAKPTGGPNGVDERELDHQQGQGPFPEHGFCCESGCDAPRKPGSPYCPDHATVLAVTHDTLQKCSLAAAEEINEQLPATRNNVNAVAAIIYRRMREGREL